MTDSGFDKDGIEERLNSDEKFRERFVADPVSELKAAGLSLSDDSAKKLTAQLADLRGKSLPSGASVAANGVVISISKSF